MSEATITRRYRFCAAHRLHTDQLSSDENWATFGKCNNPHYHGHNYELIVKLTGEPDPATGYVYDLKLLSDLVKETIIDRFDHRNLNEDTVEFKNLNPTAENIVVVIYNLLRPKIDAKYDLQVRLFETPRNFVEYPTN